MRLLQPAPATLALAAIALTALAGCAPATARLTVSRQTPMHDIYAMADAFVVVPEASRRGLTTTVLYEDAATRRARWAIQDGTLVIAADPLPQADAPPKVELPPEGAARIYVLATPHIRGRLVLQSGTQADCFECFELSSLLTHLGVGEFVRVRARAGDREVTLEVHGPSTAFEALNDEVTHALRQAAPATQPAAGS